MSANKILAQMEMESYRFTAGVTNRNFGIKPHTDTFTLMRFQLYELHFYCLLG
jgi:hypothetical protein